LTAFEVAHLLSVRDQIWSFGIMAPVVRHEEDHSSVFVHETTEEEKEACVSAQQFTEKK